jgi:hypothetical protein
VCAAGLTQRIDSSSRTCKPRARNIFLRRLTPNTVERDPLCASWYHASPHVPLRYALLLLCLAVTGRSLYSQSHDAPKSMEWKSVEFAIVHYNDEAPQSWNIYHTSKRGVLLVKIWKRYLLVNIADQQVFDIDPSTVKPEGDNVQWSTANTPAEPIEIADWKDRNVGPVQRIRFRLGKTGHILELQLPLRPDGKPAY